MAERIFGLYTDPHSTIRYKESDRPVMDYNFSWMLPSPDPRTDTNEHDIDTTVFTAQFLDIVNRLRAQSGITDVMPDGRPICLWARYGGFYTISQKINFRMLGVPMQLTAENQVRIMHGTACCTFDKLRTFIQVKNQQAFFDDLGSHQSGDDEFTL